MSSYKITTGRDGSRSVLQGKRGGRRGPNPRSRLVDDGDVDMSDRGHGSGQRQQRYNPYGAGHKNRYGGRGKLAMDQEENSAHNRLGGGSRGGGGRRNNRRRGGQSHGQQRHNLSRSPCGWYRISIPFARNLEKNFILQSINSATRVPFIPQHYRLDHDYAIFYVNDHESAQAIRDITKRISLPNGHKMIIAVKPEHKPPSVELDEATMDKVKVAMSNKYDTPTQSLNLRDFYNNADLQKDNIKLVLNRTNVMSKILDVIHDNIPELLALDISDNRLQSLDSLKEISTKAPNLVKLDLSNNNLKYDGELGKIRRLKLTELTLDGNIFCEKYRDETAYVSAMRKIFPGLLKLDGHELPPPITFDLDANTTLPQSKGSHFMNEEAQRLVCMFLEQYFALYDSDNRQALLEAYHDNAIFSMTASFNKLIAAKQNLASYLPENRNLLKVSDTVRRQKLMRIGRVNVVSLMNQLPASEHDPASVIVDVTFASPQLMSFTVHGIFRETNSKMDPPPIRAFSRTFLTVPQGSGIAIMNEQLSITSASQEQVKNAFRTPAPTPSSSPVISSGSTAPTVAPSAAGSQLTLEARQAMVQQFSTQSAMNLEWSQRCLEENGWAFETAARVFSELNAKGSIPPEAFVKSF